MLPVAVLPATSVVAVDEYQVESGCAVVTMPVPPVPTCEPSVTVTLLPDIVIVPLNQVVVAET